MAIIIKVIVYNYKFQNKTIWYINRRSPEYKTILDPGWMYYDRDTIKILG